jgi:hypothetical protein
MGMLFGIHWDCIPEKNLKSEVRKLNVEGKVCVWVGWCATTTTKNERPSHNGSN